LATGRGKPFEKETTVGGDTPRRESLYWRPLGPLREVTLYPLLFGQTRLTTGRRDKDYWEVGYDYPDYQSGWRAAEEWDGVGEPMTGWIRKHDGEFEGI
jgi:hypothetical protein